MRLTLVYWKTTLSSGESGYIARIVEHPEVCVVAETLDKLKGRAITLYYAMRPSLGAPLDTTTIEVYK